jgi:NAD-dependent SIR2 family protein deacetylase
MQATDDWRRVQEIVWEHMEELRRQEKARPTALHTLAARLELAEKDEGSKQPV